MASSGDGSKWLWVGDPSLSVMWATLRSTAEPLSYVVEEFPESSAGIIARISDMDTHDTVGLVICAETDDVNDEVALGDMVIVLNCWLLAANLGRNSNFKPLKL